MPHTHYYSPNAIWHHLRLPFALPIAHLLFTFAFAGNTISRIIIISRVVLNQLIR